MLLISHDSPRFYALFLHCQPIIGNFSHSCSLAEHSWLSGYNAEQKSSGCSAFKGENPGLPLKDPLNLNLSICIDAGQY